MSKLRRIISDPVTEDISRVIEDGDIVTNPNQYMTNDALTNPYMTNDALTDIYISKS